MFMRFFETDKKKIKRFLFTHRKNYQQMWSILNILDCVKKGIFLTVSSLKVNIEIWVYSYGYDAI